MQHLVLDLPLLLLAESGCVTKLLWQNDAFEAYNEPAAQANLRLYVGASLTTNLLVVYTEASERRGKFRTRAYWLDDNVARVMKHQRPHFARLNAGHGLEAVPVFQEAPPAGASFPHGLSAVMVSNQPSFTLYWSNRAIGTFELPSYSDGKGMIEKIALTPLAVAADSTIVGAVAGAYGAATYAEANTEKQKP